MAFNFNWSPLTADEDFYQRARDLLTTALNKSPKPPIIVDDILVTELNLGSVPPELEILEIGDLAEDRFRGIFKMCYSGDAFLTLRTRVQVRHDSIARVLSFAVAIQFIPSAAEHRHYFASCTERNFRIRLFPWSMKPLVAAGRTSFQGTVLDECRNVDATLGRLYDGGPAIRMNGIWRSSNCRRSTTASPGAAGRHR